MGSYVGFPLLMQVGTSEVLFDDTYRVYLRARAASVDATLQEGPGMPHVYQQLWWALPWGATALDEIAAWLTPRMPPEPTGA